METTRQKRSLVERPKFIGFKVTPEERKQLERAAVASRVGLSGYIRQVLFGIIRERKAA
jgi:hypothetical protein